MTPYEYHATLNHAPMSRYSPNGVDIIEECDCGNRWLHNPCIGYPVWIPELGMMGGPALGATEQSRLATLGLPTAEWE